MNKLSLATVILLLVSFAPKEASAGSPTVCSKYFTSHTASGWFTWASGNCTNGLPGASYKVIGSSDGSTGTIGQTICTNTAVYHKFTSSAPGMARCLYVDPSDTTLNLCSHDASSSSVGWDLYKWATSDCSKGSLPTSYAYSIGQGKNGNMVGETSSGGAGSGLVGYDNYACDSGLSTHYNLTTSNEHHANCLFVDSSFTKGTLCKHKWNNSQTGWRNRPWVDDDCTNGIPVPRPKIGSNYVDTHIGQARNLAGDAGSPFCAPAQGSHYNVTSSNGEVYCFYVSPTRNQGLRTTSTFVASTEGLSYPTYVVQDSSGNYFVSDNGSDCIKKITSAGVVSSFWCNSGDMSFGGMAIDSDNNLYISDVYWDCVKKIDAVYKSASCFAGDCITGQAGNTGDNSLATSARLYDPRGLAWE